MATRIQGDFSPIRLQLARPAGRSRGLRTDGPFFRADLSTAAPTRATEAHPVYCLISAVLHPAPKRSILDTVATQPIGDRLIPVEEYLSTCYEPDCEYDDGVVVERNLGEFEHSFLQIFLGTIFTNNMDAWGVFGLTEQRVQIKPRRYLIPDVCVLRVGSPRERILTRPPLIAIEILSPEDTIRRASLKAIEYLEFGVEHVWVIDPSARVAYRGVPSGLELLPSGELSVPGTPILIRIRDLFEKLDRM